jgi:hypothetical protein
MSQQKALKSHIVPKAYLKNFVESDGRLFKLRKDSNRNPRAKEVHPSEICYKKGFYQFSNIHSLQGYTVNERNILEEFGFLYENRLGKLIAKLTNPAKYLPIQDAYDLSVMLFDIKMRNQYLREKVYSDESISASIDTESVQ